MTEIEKLLLMNYDQCTNYLKTKYGNVPKDYFVNERCTQNSRGNTRTNEGLYLHHIDEDKAILLSTTEWAIKNPFDYQRADRLVYCNLLEHLVLHIKIFEFPNPNKNIIDDVGVGGIYAFIAPELNDIYSGIKYKRQWKQKITNVVLPLKDDYFKCIKKLVDLNFPYPLLTSFNERFGLWSNEKNQLLYDELKQIGVKK